MFSYLRTLALTAIITLVCAATVNYTIDPAHLFDRTNAYERGIVQMLLDGKNVANIVNYDERIAQKLYIAGLSKAPDIIAFGSSRSMQLRSTVFPGKTFFNHAVSGGSLEDHMAIYQIYRERGLAPKSVIIGADPWIFNANNGQTRWHSLASQLEAISVSLSVQAPFQDGRGGPPHTGRFVQLVSFAYLEQSLKQIWSELRRGNQEYFATHETHLPVSVELADGSLVYPAAIRNRSSEDVRIRAVGNAKRGAIYSLGGFSQLDGRAMRALDAWIQSMIDDGIEVTLFLPPYHPASYAIMTSNPRYAAVDEAAVYLRGLARDRGAYLVGDYDGARAGCSEAEFTDDMHPRDTCVSRIFQ
jgi:hypothetical protein